MEHTERIDRAKLRDFWQEHITTWEASGLSQAEYCRQHSLSRYSFYWHRKRLERESSTFLPVAVVTRPTTPLCVVLENRIRIEVAAGFDPEHLRQVIKATRGCRDEN